MTKLIIYHGGCWDGFCAAWLLWREFPDAEFMPAQYTDEPPTDEKVAGRVVYIVDFSYKRDVLERIYELATTLTVLDHHKSAKEELEGLPYCVFDMEKSGARLTHEYIDRAIHGVTSGLGTTPHWLVLYTEDRDLWTWRMENSECINAWLRSHPLLFELWDSFAEIDINDHDQFALIVAGGDAILRDQRQTIDAKVDQSHRVHVARPDGHEGDWYPSWTVANVTTLVSETGQALAETTGVGCCWFELPDGDRVYSLRSHEDGVSNFDVSVMAKAFGGGGHKNAAGFKASRHPWLPKEDS